MKSVIVYYSFSGNTQKIANLIGDILKNKDEEFIPVRVRPLKEETSFVLQCKEAFLERKPELYRTLVDLKDFDRVIIGSPVWAFKPAPAINTYLDTCSPLDGKKAICFVTYGSGAGKERALGIIKSRLEKKGATVIKTIAFQQGENLADCRRKLEELLR